MSDEKKAVIILIVFAVIGLFVIWLIVSRHNFNQSKIFDTKRQPTQAISVDGSNSLQIISIDPKGVTTSTDRFHPIVITFSQPVNPESLQYVLTPDGYEVAVEIQNNQTIVMTPKSGWDFDQNYTLTIKQSTQSINGQALQKDLSSSFSFKLDEAKLDVGAD